MGNSIKGSGETAEGRADIRARHKERVKDLLLAGAPVPVNPKYSPGLDWYAKHLEPRDFLDVADELDYVGTVEALVGSAATTSNGGMSMQLQVLPAYAHTAVDLSQRSMQGVLVAVFFQAPWELFRPDDPSPDVMWPQIAPDDDDFAGADD